MSNLLTRANLSWNVANHVFVTKTNAATTFPPCIPSYTMYRNRIETAERSCKARGNLKMNNRVEIPAYTDRWMMGDRYGVVLGAFVMDDGPHEGEEIARVKLDKSGKVVRVVYADCKEV